uniref:TOG domain-containing protein n=1 Tax=Leptobrachium leishanense TaxID=445787 RepID=A0A8C5M8U0_9ANUR
MEVHHTRVAPFGPNGDNIAQRRNSSTGRSSRTQDRCYSDVQSEISGGRNVPRVRSSSHHGRTSRQVQDEPRHPNNNFPCRVIPQDLHIRLVDMKDYKSRTHAIEELKSLIKAYDFSSVTQHDVIGFISFLCTLLDDNNYTVVLVTLDVLHCFVINLGRAVTEFLRPVISSTVKLLGDSKVTIKEEYMKIYMRLMKVSGPFKVLCILLENLKHKNSRVREEIVNICIASLLTYPSEDFNLPFLACQIAPCLIDSKRKVRHAALEAFAVLAASMGPGKSSLLKAVDEVELQENGDGLMNAVQARLARKTLPRINSQGLVEYALPCPSSTQTRGNHHLPGADTDWILPENRSQSCQNGDCRNYLPHIDPVARRTLSAGKGKNKFPWDNLSLEILELFPKNETMSVLGPDQPSTKTDMWCLQYHPAFSSRFDAHHKPIVKTPTAKTRNSAANHYGVTSDPPAALTDTVDSPIILKASLVRVPSGRKDLNRSKPVPPITKATKSLPDIHNLPDRHVPYYSPVNDESGIDDKLFINILDLSLHDDDDHEEMISSLRNVRNSAARKRAKMSGSLSDLESPDSMKTELNLDFASVTSSPVIGSYRESGVYSMESMSTPLSPTPVIKKVLEVTAAPKSKVPPRGCLPPARTELRKLMAFSKGWIRTRSRWELSGNA